jgi:hypothetical protein
MFSAYITNDETQPILHLRFPIQTGIYEEKLPEGYSVPWAWDMRCALPRLLSLLVGRYSGVPLQCAWVPALSLPRKASISGRKARRRLRNSWYEMRPCSSAPSSRMSSSRQSSRFSSRHTVSRSWLKSCKIQGVHFKTQQKFHFVTLQYNKTWNTVHKRCYDCPPFSWMQPFTCFAIFCATLKKSSLIYACNSLWDVAFFFGTIHLYTSVFYAANWSTAWGTVMYWSRSVSSLYQLQ